MTLETENVPNQPTTKVTELNLNKLLEAGVNMGVTTDEAAKRLCEVGQIRMDEILIDLKTTLRNLSIR